MSDAADDLIDGLFEDVYFPGSKRKRTDPPPPKTKNSGDWDKPKVLKVNGKDVDFFTIGQLAKAIQRKPVTIRSWETKGILPKARYRLPAPPRTMGEGRRLYTRRQVEGLVQLCVKHDILDFGSRPDRIPKAFTEDVVALWKEPL